MWTEESAGEYCTYSIGLTPAPPNGHDNSLGAMIEYIVIALFEKEAENKTKKMVEDACVALAFLVSYFCLVPGLRHAGRQSWNLWFQVIRFVEKEK